MPDITSNVFSKVFETANVLPKPMTGSFPGKIASSKLDISGTALPTGPGFFLLARAIEDLTKQQVGGEVSGAFCSTSSQFPNSSLHTVVPQDWGNHSFTCLYYQNSFPLVDILQYPYAFTVVTDADSANHMTSPSKKHKKRLKVGESGESSPLNKNLETQRARCTTS